MRLHFAERLPKLAEEIVKREPLMYSGAIATAAVAAKAAAPSSLPIVCPFILDPVRNGLAASYSRPGGNVTGLVIRAFGQFVGARAFSVLQYLSWTWRASYNKTRTPRIPHLDWR